MEKDIFNVDKPFFKKESFTREERFRIEQRILLILAIIALIVGIVLEYKGY